MSSGWLFGIGALVTVLVATGVALPIYGAILDGRFVRQERELAEVRELAAARAGDRPAA